MTSRAAILVGLDLQPGPFPGFTASYHGGGYWRVTGTVHALQRLGLSFRLIGGRVGTLAARRIARVLCEARA